MLDDYTAALGSSPLSEQTQRTYASKVRQFLAWLAAVDDLYVRRGMGPASVARAELSSGAPRALSQRAAVRFLRAVEACPSARDRAIALVPFYAGARIAELAGLDVDDVRLSPRKGILRIYGKAEAVREIPIHSQLRRALSDWLHEARTGPQPRPPPCLSTSAANGSPSAAPTTSSPPSPNSGPRQHAAHVLRHTFATRLAQGGANLVTVAELLGHAHLETTRVYTRPTRQDALNALKLLDVDH